MTNLAEERMTPEAFTTVNESPRLGGLFGTFRATRSRIVKAFGPPNSKSDPYKTSSVWLLKTPKGRFVEIYDWREDYGSERAWRRRKHILVKWHLQFTSEDAAEEVAVCLSVQIKPIRRPSSTVPKEPQKQPEEGVSVTNSA